MASDELLALLRQVRDYPLSGERVKTERKPEPQPKTDRSHNHALRVSVLLLADFEPHPYKRILSIASLYHVDPGRLCEDLEVEYSADRESVRLKPFDLPMIKKRGKKKNERP